MGNAVWRKGKADFDTLTHIEQLRLLKIEVVGCQRRDHRWIEHWRNDPDQIEEDECDGSHHTHASQANNGGRHAVDKATASRKLAALGYVHNVLNGIPEMFRAAFSAPGPRCGR